MTLQEFESAWGVKLTVLIAGTAGGVLQIIVNPQLTKFQAFVAALCGLACAHYFTPVVTHFVDGAVPARDSIAFVFGLVGMQVIASICIWSKKFSFGELIERFLKK